MGQPNVNKDIPTTGELSNEQLLVEAAQIRAAKRIKFDNNNVDEDELVTTSAVIIIIFCFLTKLNIPNLRIQQT